MGVKPGVLDGLTSIDELLKENTHVLRELRGLLEREEERETKVITFTYPYDGSGVATLQSGTTILDFQAGTITNVNNVVSKMLHSLKSEGRKWLRSFFVQSDKLIAVQADSDDPIIASEERDAVASQQEFRKLKLTALEETKVFIYACTSPEAAIQLVSSPQTNFDVRKEFVRNGSFEYGSTKYWEATVGTIEICGTEHKRGLYSGEINGDVIVYAIRHTDYVPVAGNEIYKILLWMKGGDSLTYQYLSVLLYDSGLNYIDTIDIGQKLSSASWTLLTGYLSVPEECSFMQFNLHGMASTTLYIDSVSIQKIRDRLVEHHVMFDVTNDNQTHTVYSEEFFTGIWNYAEYNLYLWTLAGPSPTLDVRIQSYDPDTQRWVDAIVFDQLTGVGEAQKQLSGKIGWKQRARYDLVGSTDCDFGLGVVYKSQGVGSLDTNGNIKVTAPNLEQAEDVTHASGDKGVMALAVRKDDVGSLCGADGDYTPLILNEHGVLRTQAQQHYHIDECEAITGWTVLGNDTINLATTTNHVCNQYALEFDKVNGAANTKIAGIQKTITSFDFTPYHKGGGFALISCYLSSLTSVDYCFLRLGTDASNYTEWRCDADDLDEGWNFCRHTACKPIATVGNGWNSAAITYVAIGVAFEAETDTLADIAVDHLAVNTGLMTSIPVEAAKNINLLKIKNKVVDIGEGAAGTGTQRVATSFSGAFYSKNFTAPDAAAEAPIEASAKKLKDVVIHNTHATYEVELREASGDWVEIGPRRSTGFTLVDLNTVYIKAQTDGENAVLDIWGVLV